MNELVNLSMFMRDTMREYTEGCSDVTVICGHDTISMLWVNVEHYVKWEIDKSSFPTFVTSVRAVRNTTMRSRHDH